MRAEPTHSQSTSTVLNDDVPVVFAAVQFSIFAAKIADAVSVADADDGGRSWPMMSSAMDYALAGGVWDARAIALYSAAATHLAWISSLRASELRGAHPAFVEQLHVLIPGATIIKERPPKNGHCDFLVMVDGKRRPVEIKPASFTNKAKAQLRRYMVAHSADIGYAVAKELRCDLDDDMRFLRLSW